VREKEETVWEIRRKRGLCQSFVTGGRREGVSVSYVKGDQSEGEVYLKKLLFREMLIGKIMRFKEEGMVPTILYSIS